MSKARMTAGLFFTAAATIRGLDGKRLAGIKHLFAGVLFYTNSFPIQIAKEPLTFYTGLLGMSDKRSNTFRFRCL
jgi:hypothetical protein